jgi:hypothetical protein
MKNELASYVAKNAIKKDHRWAEVHCAPLSTFFHMQAVYDGDYTPTHVL